MHRPIPLKLFNNLIKQTQITRRELFALTRKACDYASVISPFIAFTNQIEMQCERNISFPSETLKNDIFELSENVQRYEENQRLFKNIFSSTKCIEMSAYSMYVHKHGIAGYVDVENIPYFRISWNKLKSKDNEWNELASIYILLIANIDKFKQKRIKIYCDNANVISMLQQYKAKTSRPDLQSAITKIAGLCLKYQINPYWSRINGVNEIIADRLARSVSDPFQYSSFRPQSKPNQNAFKYLSQFR